MFACWYERIQQQKTYFFLIWTQYENSCIGFSSVKMLRGKKVDKNLIFGTHKSITICINKGEYYYDKF